VRAAAAERDELVVGAALDDAAAVEDVDAVDRAHGAEAMADEHPRLQPHELVP
jgi:hypothetical protein